jgi:hypothetical protein
MMNRAVLLTSVALGLAIGAAPSIAQQPGPAAGGEQPQMRGAPGESPGAPGQAQEQKQRPLQKGAADQKEPRGQGTKGAAQGTEPRAKGSAQSEPRDKVGQGTPEKSAEPKGKATKGAAEKSPEPRDKATKGTAEKGAAPQDKAAKSAEPKDKGANDKGALGTRVQLSEQQRSNLGQTVLKDRSVNRVSNLNVSIDIGVRVPRSVRLAVLPASVIAIVPAYRNYRYFVVDGRICIVEPDSYEIVEIIVVSDQTAGRDTRGPATLVLTDEERMILLREIDRRGGSTLGLGALTEGAEVPGGIEVHVFPDRIVERVPKVRGYKFFTVENRLAIVDPQGARVSLVIEDRR